MKALFLIVFACIFNICKIFCQEDWSRQEKIDDIILANISTLAVDSSNRVIFPASDNIFIQDSLNFQKINGSLYSDTKYYNLRSFEVSKDNILWGASELGFMKYYLDNDSLAFFDRKSIKGDWDYEYINGLTIDNNNDIWFTSRNPYLSKLSGNEFTDYDVSYENKILSINFHKTKLLADTSSNIWVSGDDGILAFSTTSTQNNYIYKKFTLEELNFKNACAELCFDKINNIIWASSRNGEVSYFKENKWNQLVIPDSLIDKTKLGGISNNFINKIYIDKNNRVNLFWHTSNYYLILDNYIIKKYVFPSSICNTSLTVFSVVNDKYGSLYLGTLENGLIKKINPIINTVDNQILSDFYIRKIYPNPSKNIVTIEMVLNLVDLDEYDVRLNDLMGLEVVNLTSNIDINYISGESSCTFNIEKLNQGVYFLCVSKGQEKISKMIVKY